MNFKSTVMPGVRAFASTMRVKPCRERPVAAHSPFSSPSSRTQAQLRATWRVCPSTGQLQQRWSLDESQEPPSWCFAHLLQQASLMLGLYFGARTFS